MPESVFLAIAGVLLSFPSLLQWLKIDSSIYANTIFSTFSAIITCDLRL